MVNEAVYLSEFQVERHGKTYSYWRLQWVDGNGKKHSQSIGSTKKLSRRQAEKLRRQKELEFNNKPGRRNTLKSPLFGDYLETYIENRRDELASSTLELHQQAGRYLVAYFGRVRKVSNIKRLDARAFKAALARGDLASEGHTDKLSEASVHLYVRTGCMSRL